jgi:hypothetical protein
MFLRKARKIRGYAATCVNATVSRQAEIISESLNLMHPLVQDRNDADVIVREAAPIDKMLFVAEEVTFDTKLRRHGS